MKKFLLVLLATLLAAVFYTLLVAIPQMALRGDRIPITKDPGEVGLAFEAFTTSPADQPALQLAGWWMPAQAPRAALVFIHGGGSNRHTDYLKALEFYAAMVEQGISVTAIDLRNHGASDADEAGLGFGISEQADAIAAVNWARDKTPGLPIFLMGISMGGATVIHAAAAGAQVDGLVLLDPLLETSSAFTRAVWTETGLPPSLFAPAAWSAVTLYGLPGEGEQALDVARGLKLPMLLIQDPDDPVILAEYARELSADNPAITLWEAPPISADHPEIPWRERWGSHVAAFAVYPRETVGQILAFIEQVSPETAD